MGFEVNVEGPRRMFCLLNENDEIVSHCPNPLLTGWLVILIVLAACLILTKDLKKIPDTKRQCAAEYIVKTVNNMVSVNMDKSSLAYAPYIAAVFSYIYSRYAYFYDRLQKHYGGYKRYGRACVYDLCACDLHQA